LAQQVRALDHHALGALGWELPEHRQLAAGQHAVTDRREQPRRARLEPARVYTLQQPWLLDTKPVRARPLAEGLRCQQRDTRVRGGAPDVEIEQQLLLDGQPAAQVRVRSRGAITELARDPGARDVALLAAVGAPREPVDPPWHRRERELD